MEAVLHTLNGWIPEDNPEKLRTLMNALLVNADFEVLGFVDHHFEPQGYTCIWLLGESHLAVHTYPEEKQAYFELTSCILEKSELVLKELTAHYPHLSHAKIAVSRP